VAGKNERQRRQARERHRRQQEQRVVRQRQVRQRWLIGLSGVLVLALIGTLLLVFLPGGKAKKASASPSNTLSFLRLLASIPTTLRKPHRKHSTAWRNSRAIPRCWP
jgi:hypothetical protein